MHRLVDAPSPRNGAKLLFNGSKFTYIPGRVKGACDAAIPKKRGRVADAISTFVKSLGGMTEDSRNKALDALFDILDAADPTPSTCPDPEAEDEPPEFPGRPHPGGQVSPSSKDPFKGTRVSNREELLRASNPQHVAQDAAEGFAQRYPEAMLVRPDPYSAAPPARKTHKNTNGCPGKAFF